MSNNHHLQTGKFYTAARKFPQLIGVTPSGEAIPGGPYTVTQFALAIGTLVLGFATRSVWGTDEIISDTLIIIFVTVGVTYGAGRLPRSRRSIFNLINCTISLLSRPRTGKYRGRKIPASYSRGHQRSRKNTTVSETSDDHETTTGSIKPPRPQINSGLDRLTADLTSNR